MAGERRQRVRGGERLEIAPLELRAARERVDAVERAGRARGLDAPRAASPSPRTSARPSRTAGWPCGGG